MTSEEEIWNEIIETFSPGRIRDLKGMEEISIQERDPLEVILEIDDITKQGFGVTLKDFYIDLSPRILRKYLPLLKWRRIGSKKNAIKERVTPYMLFAEAKGKIKSDKCYIGTGWRGLSIRENKNFLLYSWIEGWELFSIAKSLIKVNRYDIPEELRRLDDEERARISKEISKITTRRIGLEKEIMGRGGIRTGVIPSRTERGKLYDDMRMDGLPIKFLNIPSNLHHATWFDLMSQHNCKDKQMFISYIRPREKFFCAHDIAFMITAHNSDNFDFKYQYRKNPYLIFTPFPKPNPAIMDANQRYRKQIFEYDKDGKRNPIGKIKREICLFHEIKATNAKFF